jgi:hypothetical protein
VRLWNKSKSGPSRRARSVRSSQDECEQDFWLQLLVVSPKPVLPVDQFLQRGHAQGWSDLPITASR